MSHHRRISKDDFSVPIESHNNASKPDSEQHQGLEDHSAFAEIHQHHHIQYHKASSPEEGNDEVNQEQRTKPFLPETTKDISVAPDASQTSPPTLNLRNRAPPRFLSWYYWIQTNIFQPVSTILPWDLFVAAVAIMSSLILYGYLQESVMSREYVFYSNTVPSDGSLVGSSSTLDHKSGKHRISSFFNSSLFLVFQNRIYAVFISLALIAYRGKYTDLINSVPVYKYAAVSLSNVVATSCQYEALKWVNFPTQTLFKCGKMIPVMILSSFISRKKYGWVDYFAAVIVALGCTAFLSAGDVIASRAAKTDTDEGRQLTYGVLLMCLYICSDSFTSTLQEYLFRTYDLSVTNQMFYVNVTSSIVSFVLMILLGELRSAFTFVFATPRVLWDTSFLSISAVCAQYAITHTVRKFGALTYVTIMTIRQIISVVLSNLAFGHHLSVLQWSCSFSVFGVLIFQKMYSRRKSQDTPS